MALQLSKKEKKLLLFGSMLIILAFLFLFINYLQPLKMEVQTQEKQYETNKQLYESVLKQQTDVKENVIENTQYLQKRLPVKHLLDQFILDLEKTETMSNSLILKMDFGNGNTEEDTVGNDDLGVTTQQEENGAEIELKKNLPSGVEKISVNLLIKSPSYFDLEKFLDIIENLDRIVTVESIQFSGNPEVTNLDQVINYLNYQVSLSLYYMPELEDLQNELPKIESGKPANKSNPLNQFDDLTENSSE